MSVRFRPENTRKILVMMANLFNDVKSIKRKKGQDDVDVNVPVFVESAEKIITKYKKPDSTRQYLPGIGMSITSMDADEERMMPPYNKILAGNQYVFNPVPYNYTIDVTLLALRESEIFDLLEQIVPFYQKARYYPLITLKFVDGNKIQNDIPVELTSTPVEITSTDLGMEDEQVYGATLSFVVKSWVYGYNPTLNAGSPPRWWLSLQNNNTGNIPTESPSYWSEILNFDISGFGTGDGYSIGDHVRYDGNIYKSTMNNNTNEPTSTGSGWTFVIDENAIPPFLDSKEYSINNLVTMPSPLGVIQCIDISYENTTNAIFESMQIKTKEDGLPDISIN